MYGLLNLHMFARACAAQYSLVMTDQLNNLGIADLQVPMDRVASIQNIMILISVLDQA